MGDPSINPIMAPSLEFKLIFTKICGALASWRHVSGEENLDGMEGRFMSLLTWMILR